MKNKCIIICISMLLFATSISVAVNTNNIESVNNDDGSSRDIDWWPMFHHDPANTGYSTSPAPETDDLLWNTSINDDVLSSPVIVDNEVFVGSYDGTFYCLNLYNGEPLWDFPTEGSIASTPAVVDGKVFFGSYDRTIYCLDATNNGDLLWDEFVGSYISSSPAVDDGRVYMGAWNGDIYCFDIGGDIIWTYTIGGSCWSSPAVSNGKVYVASGNTVYCLDAEGNGDGTTDLIWEYNLGMIFLGCSPAIDNGNLYIAANTHLYCLDAEGDPQQQTTTENWNSSISNVGFTISSPAVAQDRVYIGTYEGNLTCLNASDGDFIDSFQTGGTIQSSPAIADGKVYFGSDDGKVYCVSADELEEIWNFTTNDVVKSSPAVSYGAVCIGSNDDNVYCFRTGNPPNIPNQPTGPTIGIVGVEYCYATDPVTDPDGDDVEYLFDWGDGTDSGWLDIPDISCHIWSEEGIFEVKVKARDENLSESAWSDPLLIEIIMPDLEIDPIAGGILKVKATISNNAGVDLTDINFTIKVTGGVLGLINKTNTKTIDLADGESENITAQPIIGLGAVDIIVTASLGGNEVAKKKANGVVVLFIVFVQ